MAKPNWQCPNEWLQWSEWLAAGLHARNRWRLPVLWVGILFAQGRRTVTTWLRAAGVSDDFQDYDYFLAAVGRKTNAVATQLLALVLRTLPLPDRATIEQDFHDIKEVWGAGQQQVRNIWTNVAVFNLNLWMHTMVELWAWDRNHADLSDRSDSPWDDAERRPSHANRRKALRQLVMRNEFSTLKAAWWLPRKIIHLAERLMALAA